MTVGSYSTSWDRQQVDMYIYIYIYICKKTPIVNTHLQEKDGKQNKSK